jgi:hypothetical protein
MNSSMYFLLLPFVELVYDLLKWWLGFNSWGRQEFFFLLLYPDIFWGSFSLTGYQKGILQGPHPASVPVETNGPVCRDKEAGGGSQPLCLMLRLTICGTLLPLPPYTLMAWCLGLDIIFTFDSANHAGNEDNCHLGCDVDHYQYFGGTCCLHFRLEESVFTCSSTRLHSITSHRTVTFIVATWEHQISLYRSSVNLVACSDCKQFYL